MARTPTFYTGTHSQVVTVPDRVLVFYSGTVGVEWQGGTSSWSRDELTIHLPGSEFLVDVVDVTPTAGLAAISNGGYSVNAGWAVDQCTWVPASDGINLKVALAVSDTDGRLLRVSYFAAVTAHDWIRLN